MNWFTIVVVLSKRVRASVPRHPGAIRSYFASNAGSTNGVPECIGSAMSQDRRFTALAAAVLLSMLSLGGCVTSTPTDARAEVPGPPKPTAYLPVEGVPPRPEKPAMTADEQSKLKKDLIAARDRQPPKGKAKGDGAHAEPVKP